MRVTDEMVQAFGEAWAATPEGAPGDRRRAGLEAALAAARCSCPCCPVHSGYREEDSIALVYEDSVFDDEAGT